MAERIIFDLDGTLIEPNYAYDYFNSCLSKYEAARFIPNISKLLGNYEATYENYNMEILVRYLSEMTGIQFSADIINSWRAELRGRPPKTIDGVIEVLEYLKERGYSLAVLSNWFLDDQVSRLSKAGLIQYFDDVYGGDKVLKPDSRSFYEAAGDFSVSSCVMIGDNVSNDVIGAYRAGMDAIYFDRDNTSSCKTLVKKSINNMKDLKEIY